MTATLTSPRTEITHLLGELRKQKQAMDEAQLEMYTAETQVERAGFARLYSAQSRLMDDDLGSLARRIEQLP